MMWLTGRRMRGVSDQVHIWDVASLIMERTYTLSHALLGYDESDQHLADVGGDDEQ